MDLPEFPELAKVLARVEADVGASELHGMACGALAVNAAAGVESLAKFAFGGVEAGNVLTAEAAAEIKTMHDATLLQLQDPEMGLELLLPDDDYGLVDRMQAACEWARGLVLGFALQGVSVEKALPEDSKSFLTDCANIGRSEFEVEESEEHELVFVELVDYLRTGALLVQEEINPEKTHGPVH